MDVPRPSYNRYIIVFVIAALITTVGILSYEVYQGQVQTNSFSPKLDGIFSGEDRWDTATNVHTYYLTLDEEHQTGYNYLYSRVANGFLYICFDFCSDITDSKDEGEFLLIFIDSDGSFDQFNYTTLFNHAGSAEHFLETEFVAKMDAAISDFTQKFDSSIEVVAWNVSSSNSTLGFSLNRPGVSGSPSYAIINSTTTFKVATGFGKSPNSGVNHRIFEVAVNMTTISGLSGDQDNYGLLVEGYGTAMTPITVDYDANGFYCLPGDGMARLAWELDAYVKFTTESSYYHAADDTFPNSYTSYVSMLLIASNEFYYFRCGLPANDLN